MKEVKITEEQLNHIVNMIKESNGEIEEGFFGNLGSDIGSLSLSNIGAGLKGMFGGQGYKLARQMNIVKNSVDKLDRMRDKLSNIMTQLRHVYVDVSELKSNDPFIQRIGSNLEGVVKHYENMRIATDNLRTGVIKYYQQQEQLKQAKQKQKP